MTSRIQINRANAKANPILTWFLSLVTQPLTERADPLVSHDAFLVHATPSIIGQSLEDKPEYHEALVQATYQNLGKGASMPVGFIRMMTPADTASLLTRAIAGGGLDPAVIRNALTPQEWVLALDQQLVWEIINHGLAIQKNAAALQRALDYIDTLVTDEGKMVTAQEKLSILDPDCINEMIPNEYRLQISGQAIRRSMEKPPRGLTAEEVLTIVNNVVLVDALDAERNYELIVTVMQRLGLLTTTVHVNANTPPAASTTPSASAPPSGTSSTAGGDGIEIDDEGSGDGSTNSMKTTLAGVAPQANSPSSRPSQQ